MYLLPDGCRVQLDSTTARLPEIIFKPHQERDSVAEMARQSIQGCNMYIRRALANTVLLSGGATLLRGFSERLLWELNQHGGGETDASSSHKVLAPSERMLSVWIGASILGSLPNFRQMWIGSDDYYDRGPRVAHEIEGL